MQQPDVKSEASWLHRVRERIRGRRPDAGEHEGERRRRRIDPNRIEQAKKQDKHDPMSGVGGSW